MSPRLLASVNSRKPTTSASSWFRFGTVVDPGRQTQCRPVVHVIAKSDLKTATERYGGFVESDIADRQIIAGMAENEIDCTHFTHGTCHTQKRFEAGIQVKEPPVAEIGREFLIVLKLADKRLTRRDGKTSDIPAKVKSNASRVCPRPAYKTRQRKFPTGHSGHNSTVRPPRPASRTHRKSHGWGHRS